MAFLDALRAFFTPLPYVEPPYLPLDVVMQERSLSTEQLWSAFGESSSTAGTKVDTESALRSIAVQAAVRLLTNDIGSLPVDAFRRLNDTERKELRKPAWVVEPNPLNPNATWEDHVKATVFGMLSDGNGFTRCFPSVFDAQGIEALNPLDVDIKPFRGSVIYEVKGEGSLSPAEVIHLPWMVMPGKTRGFNPIEAAKQGIGVALAADQFVGAYFGNGAILSGVLEYPQGVEPTPEQIAGLKADFKQKHVGARKSHAIGALTGGAKWVPFDYNNRDAQLLELREHIVEEVARLFGIPPHMLGSQRPGAVSYASVEQRSQDYVTHAILPIVKRIEVGYSRLLRGSQTYLRFNMEGLMRGDATARAAFYNSMLNNKVIRREEVRAKEDLPFDPDGVGYLETPNNNAPDAPADPAARSAEPVINLTFPDHFDIPAPIVNVAPPDVRIEPAVVNVAPAVVEGLDDLRAAITDLRADLGNMPAPIVNVAPALVQVTVPPQKPTRKVVRRDAEGRIVDVIDAPLED